MVGPLIFVYLVYVESLLSFLESMTFRHRPDQTHPQSFQDSAFLWPRALTLNLVSRQEYKEEKEIWKQHRSTERLSQALQGYTGVNSVGWAKAFNTSS